MRTTMSFAIAILIGSATLGAAADHPAPSGASPGAEDRILQVESRCPAFAWEAVPDALLTQLVVYRLTESADPADADPAQGVEAEALYTEAPGGVGAWTPPSDQCLATARYVWFVRAVYALDGEEIADAGPWSEGLYFEIPAAPSVDDVRQALDLLQRYVDSGGDPAVLTPAGGGAAHPAAGAPVQPPGSAGPKSTLTASAAIRGEHPGATGETYGLVGSSASPDGAGVAAASIAGGADLVLDGSADGLADARLSQSGLDVPSAIDQSFTAGNSAGGGFTLQVDGDVAATSFAGDGSALTGIQAADADTLDGHHGAHYTDASNLDAGTVPISRYSALADLTAEGHLGDAAGDLARNTGALQPTLNADLLDGLHASVFADASNLSAGTLATGRYSAYADLDAEGYLDMSAGTDLVTKSDGDDRYLNETGDRVRGDLTVQEDGARLVSVATPADVSAGDVIKLEVQDPAGASLFAVDSTGIVSALSYDGDGSRLSGITADDLDCPGCVDAVDLADGSVGHLQIATGAVRSTEIYADAVNTEEIADSAVTSAKIADSTITAADLGRDSVGASEIAPNAVGASEIATDAVGSDEIADFSITDWDVGMSAVTAFGLAPNAVNSTKIANGSITAADVDPAGGVYASKLALYSNEGYIWLNPGTHDVAIAQCNDANDLPLQIQCGGDSHTYLTWVDSDAWNQTSAAAVGRCSLRNTGSMVVYGTAKIWCISVPGP